MSFTKVTSAGIGSTELVTLDSLEVINNASIGGVLTYEDVTNVDSIGIITARAGVLVGSGITLSKDGDIFATGVCTATSFVGSGANLTGVASTENIRTNTNATFLQNINVSGSTTTGSLVSSGAISGTTGTFTGDVSIADAIVHTGDDSKIRFPSNDVISFETSGSEGARFDAGRRFLIGSTTARTSGGAAYAHLQVEGTDSPGAEILVIRNSNDTYASTLGLVKTRGTSDGAVTTVQDNDKLGQIQFRGADGSDIYSVAASIHGEVDGSPSDGTDMPGALVFGTTADGAASPTERLRIDSKGQLSSGGSTTAFGGTSSLNGLQMYYETDSGLASFGSYSSGGGTNLAFYTNSGGSAATEKLRITSAGKVCINNDTALSDLHVCTAGSSEEDGTLRIGGSGSGLGLVLDYDQAGATVARISANDNYNSNTSALKICSDLDDNPNQLVLLGSGNVGINEASPTSRFYVNSSHYVVTSSGESTTGIHIDGTAGNAGEYGGGISFNCGGTGSAAIAARQGSADPDVVGLSFFTHSSGTASADAEEKVRIHDGGVTSFNNGICLGNSLTLSTNNTLDDYEEGTFSPGFSGDSGSGSYGYSRQQGIYTKIGNTVYFSFYITTNAVSSNASGNTLVIGLPFTSGNGDKYYQGASIGYYNGWNNVTPTSVLVDVNNTRLYVYKNNQTTNILHSSPSDVTIGTSFIVSGHYHVA